MVHYISQYQQSFEEFNKLNHLKLNLSDEETLEIINENQYM